MYISILDLGKFRPVYQKSIQTEQSAAPNKITPNCQHSAFNFQHYPHPRTNLPEPCNQNNHIIFIQLHTHIYTNHQIYKYKYKILKINPNTDLQPDRRINPPYEKKTQLQVEEIFLFKYLLPLTH